MNAAPAVDGRARTRGPHTAPPTAPLAGVTVDGTAAGPAGAVALDHLRALGARHRPGVRTPRHAATEHLTVLSEDGLHPLVCEILPFPDAPGSRLGETALQAMAGLMAVNGRQGNAPRRLPLDYVAACAGVLAVQGVLAALIARTRGARLGRIRTARSSAALLSVSQYLAAETAPDGTGPHGTGPHGTGPDGTGPDGPAEPRPTARTRTGTGAGAETGAGTRTGTGPPFLSRDGVWFELEALDGTPWRDFWAALGLRGREVPLGWRTFVNRYSAARAPLPPLLHRTLGTRDFTDIAAAGARSGLSVCRIRTTAERYAEEEPLPAPWSLRPPGTQHTQHPEHTEHTERPFSRPAPQSAPHVLPTAGQPLRGITVVEATRRIQGPMAGHVLQMLGAHVVRVEPPGGDPQRAAEPVVGDCSARFLALNEAKSVVEADLKTAEGRRTVRDLALRADVFLHNWAPGKAEVFGLDAEALCTANPALVYAHASGWGPSSAPDLFPGTDFMVQARSGLAWEMAEGADRPRPTLMTVLDILGGLISAEGVLAGLLARELGGGPQRVDTSLLSAASVLQRLEADRAPSARAHAAWEGPYRTANGHIALSLPAAGGRSLLATALNIPATGPHPPLRDTVAARLLTRPARSWIEDLGTNGIDAVLVQEDIAAVARDPAFRADLRHGACALVAPPWRFLS
ncbi:CoA transferase [Streptomyces sp. NPDC001599]|uniref:CoA transferase n=1 Tax=Streptomyces sp. NPDC001599 TaxID=3364591 RepID=UPI0036C93C3D